MKYNLLLFLTIIPFWLSAQQLTDGLVLHYLMNGNLVDESDFQNDAIQYASFGKDRFGEADKAAKFNGIDEYIEIPNDPSIKPPLPVTISFWIKLDGNPSGINKGIFLNNFRPEHFHGIWVHLDTNKRIGFNFGGGDIGPLSRNSVTSSVPLDTLDWHHIVGIIRGPYDFDIYIDCIKIEGILTGTGTEITYSFHSGCLGKVDGSVSPTSPYGFFNGRLDDFAMWNRELSEEEVQLVCDSGLITDSDTVSSFDSPIELSIYPNPVSNILYIKSTEVERFEIFSSIGTLLNQTYKSNNIDVSSLARGNYFIKITTSNEVATFKFTKI